MIQDIFELHGSPLRRQLRRVQAVVFYLDTEKDDLILDIGCGEGFIASHLLDAKFVVGLDESKGSLSIAKQKSKKSNIDFIRADVRALPIKMKSFDKVTVLEVLEHLPVEKQRILCSDVDKVVKDDGAILISVPYKEKISHTYCIHCGKQTPLWGHLFSLDDSKITELMSNQYSLVSKCILPNVSTISLSRFFQYLPFRIWLIINKILGWYHKGYWVILKYQKENNLKPETATITYKRLTEETN